jgi:hypothetical protein
MAEESLGEESWRNHVGGGIMAEESWRGNHGGGIMGEQSWRRNHGAVAIVEKTSGSHVTAIWEASEMHAVVFGVILEAFGG